MFNSNNWAQVPEALHHIVGAVEVNSVETCTHVQVYYSALGINAALQQRDKSLLRSLKMSYTTVHTR